MRYRFVPVQHGLYGLCDRAGYDHADHQTHRDDDVMGGQAELLMRFLFGLLGIEWDAPFTVCKKNSRGTVSGND